MPTYCNIHRKTKLVTFAFCPKCRGGASSVKKAKASRRNGRLGGRPKKKRP